MATYDDFWGRYSAPGMVRGATPLPAAPAAPNASTAPTSSSPNWAGMIPGALDLATGLYTNRLGQNEAASRLNAARGPIYDASNAAAGGMLSQLNQFNPQDFADQRFAAHQALVAPVDQKQQDDLMRSLYAKGMLGSATYNPGVEGITPNGTAMNPQMAALFAAQAAARAKAADASIGQGMDYRNQLVTNAGMLTGNAQRAQQTGLTGQMTQPSHAAGVAEFLRGASGVLKDSGVVKQLPGMISSGYNWLANAGKKLFDSGGGGSGPMVGDFGTPNYDFNDSMVT